MSYSVVSHQLDEAAGVYRLVVGLPVHDVRPMSDDDGSILLDDENQVVTEQVFVGYTAVEDFIFAADDDRWSGKGMKKIATEQRDEVSKLLKEREQEATAPAPESDAEASVVDLPGVGEEL